MPTIEAGYFDQWGEWHDACDGKPNVDLTDDVRSKHLDAEPTWSRLITELLQYVPDNRYVMIRYPAKKPAVFDDQPVTFEEAYEAADKRIGKARVGHHNDYFLASEDDVGTYQPFGTSASVTELKDYVSKETEYLPMGGETCAPYNDEDHRFSCVSAVQEMEQLHWSYLNQDYYEGAIESWKEDSGGCLDEIDRRLGYRLELQSATLPDTLIKGTTQTAQFQIHNSGFARVHFYRKAYLRIFQGSQVVKNIELSGVDLRMIGSGESMTVEGTFVVPDDIAEQQVSVALWLPDETNPKNSRFSIRLAYQQDESDWAQAASPGHNLLAHDISIVPAE